MSNATQDGLVAHVLDMLQDLGGVSARRMFGGYGLYCQGAMLGLIARDTLYLRVDDRNRPDFLAVGARAFSYRRGQAGEVEIKGYMECPPDIIEEAEAMVGWARRALAAALAAKATKPTRKSRSARRG
jgi:DNA transformation protein